MAPAVEYATGEKMTTNAMRSEVAEAGMAGLRTSVPCPRSWEAGLSDELETDFTERLD